MGIKIKKVRWEVWLYLFLLSIGVVGIIEQVDKSNFWLVVLVAFLVSLFGLYILISSKASGGKG